MLLVIIALIVSFVPSLLLFLFLLNNRKDDEEYRKNCISLLGKGFLICMITFGLDLLLKIPWNMIGIGKKNPWIDRLFTCFVINATVEEISKFLTARKVIYKNPAKTSKLEIMTYMIIAAIAFGLFEDIVYVFSTNIGQIIVRGILMGHVPYQMFMGEFYSRSIVEKKPYLKVLAFVIPILFHGTYNFLLTEGLPDWAAAVVFVELIIEIIYMVRTIILLRKKKDDPEYNRPILQGE